MRLHLDGSLAEVNTRGRTITVELAHPRLAHEFNAVEVGLMDVRAADSGLILYDFERDGWSIQQASVFEWEGCDPDCDPRWQEVAFVKAWQLDQRRLECA